MPQCHTVLASVATHVRTITRLRPAPRALPRAVAVPRLGIPRPGVVARSRYQISDACSEKMSVVDAPTPTSATHLISEAATTCGGGSTHAVLRFAELQPCDFEVALTFRSGINALLALKPGDFGPQLKHICIVIQRQTCGGLSST